MEDKRFVLNITLKIDYLNAPKSPEEAFNRDAGNNKLQYLASRYLEDKEIRDRLIDVIINYGE